MDGADDGALDAGGDGGVLAAAELDDVEIDGERDAVDLIRGLAGEDADEKGTVGRAGRSEGFWGGVDDFDARADCGADRASFVDRDLTSGRGEDDADQVGPGVDRDAGVLGLTQTTDLDAH
jgi:hypothetical protein